MDADAYFGKSELYLRFANCIMSGPPSAPHRKTGQQPPVAVLVVPGSLEPAEASKGRIWLEPNMRFQMNGIVRKSQSAGSPAAALQEYKLLFAVMI